MGLIPEQADAPTGAEHRCRLGRPPQWIDPVPGLAGGQQVEAAGARLPRFDGARLDHYAAAAGDLCHAGIGLEADHGAAPGHEETGGDPRPATHIEHGPGPTGQQCVDQLDRILRPDPVVLLGHFAEGAGPPAVAVQCPFYGHRDPHLEQRRARAARTARAPPDDRRITRPPSPPPRRGGSSGRRPARRDGGWPRRTAGRWPATWRRRPSAAPHADCRCR